MDQPARFFSLPCLRACECSASAIIHSLFLPGRTALVSSTTDPPESRASMKKLSLTGDTRNNALTQPPTDREDGESDPGNRTIPHRSGGAFVYGQELPLKCAHAVLPLLVGRPISNAIQCCQKRSLSPQMTNKSTCTQWHRHSTQIKRVDELRSQYHPHGTG